MPLLLPLLLALQQAPLAVRPDTVHPVHDALHYDITVILDDSSRYVLGEVETKWRLGSNMPVEVALDSSYRVIRVLVDGKPNTRIARTLWGQANGLVVIPHEKQAGDTLTTRIRYRGQAADGLILRKNQYGVHTAFADNWPDRAHRWFPSVDHPSDKATVAFHVQAPGAFTVIANGLLEKVDTLPRGVRVWHYRLDQPIPTYSMVLGAAPFARTVLAPAQCAVRCVPIEVWSFRQDSAYAATAFARAPQIVDYLASLAGPFPYPALRHVQSSTMFGGMENATAIFYDEKIYAAKRMGEPLIAHETAHQWFGDAVTETDWHHLWLSEGFATYFAALWVGHAQGDSAFRATMAAAAAAIMKSPLRDRPIIDPDATDLLKLLSVNNYQKGSWVLRELHAQIGDSAFFRGIRAYVDRYRHGNALSADFMAVMQETSGKELGWLFTQALTQPGYPELDVAWRWSGGTLGLTVTQTQAANWGLYRMPGLVIDVDGTRVPLDVQGKTTTATVPLPKAPTRVVVDPDGAWLLSATVREAR